MGGLCSTPHAHLLRGRAKPELLSGPHGVFITGTCSSSSSFPQLHCIKPIKPLLPHQHFSAPAVPSSAWHSFQWVHLHPLLSRHPLFLYIYRKNWKGMLAVFCHGLGVSWSVWNWNLVLSFLLHLLGPPLSPSGSTCDSIKGKSLSIVTTTIPDLPLMPLGKTQFSSLSKWW